LNELAVRQIEELVAVSEGSVELVESRQEDAGLVIDVSLETRGIQTSGAGIKVREHERFQLLIPQEYPYRPPAVWVPHRRWAGTPHVQWGRYLCLYAAAAVEWNPADGMRGIIERLVSWLMRAAEGTLDPDGQPLHPPVTYTSTDAGQVIIHSDVGDLVPWGDTVTPGQTNLVYAWCGRNGARVDIYELLSPDDAYDRVLAPEFDPLNADGRPYFVAPVVMVSNELSMEYPRTAAVLADSLEGFGFSRNALMHAITSAHTFNRAIAASAFIENTAPIVVVLGTPARRVEGFRRLAHLTAWRLDDLGSDITGLLSEVQHRDEELAEEVRDFADRWIGSADVNWMVVHDNRPEVTNRRDGTSTAAWLQGKRVLVLGCGALGAPIAEQCVRAGVGALTVVDKGIVNPGILVRQPYTDADIGDFKARRLAGRLSGIRRDLTVEALVCNAVSVFVGDELDVQDYDLVIDACADVGVRAAIETARATHRDRWPPLITGLFGHEALRALGILSRPSATGGGHDVLRRIAVDARGAARAEWHDVADDFFPDPPRTKMFFPEPGCSEPTFTGSAIQTEALASALFWATITELADEQNPEPMVAMAIRLADATAAPARASRLSWTNDLIRQDLTGRYEIRLSARALEEMRVETRRGARTRGPHVETGGMLLGAFDDAVGCVYIDTAAGPSADSTLSPLYFGHGTAGTQELVEHYQTRTTHRVGFVGMWHTHPFGVAHPSPTDEAGMGWIVSPKGSGRRALMLILGGTSDCWNDWRERGDTPDIYLRVVDRYTDAPPPANAGQSLTIMPAGSYPGGFYQPDPQSPHQLSWWQNFFRWPL
jgi:hypothetical protein